VLLDADALSVDVRSWSFSATHAPRVAAQLKVFVHRISKAGLFITRSNSFEMRAAYTAD
jgi:hypothetical protein